MEQFLQTCERHKELLGDFFAAVILVCFIIFPIEK